ncbi:hypothetical protein [Actinomadura logoneensis]|nr:hypothetical protein [Actinomadura logoneensis]
MKIGVGSTAAAALTMAASLVFAAPAVGAESVQLKGSKCVVWEKTWNKFSGWCNGRGPATYQATITCTGGEHQGQRRWLGDRRGSTAYCTSGRRVASKFKFTSG